MHIKIVGFPCARVEQTLMNAHAAVAEFEMKLEVHWVGDIYEVARMGGVSTPTVIVNEKLKSSGRIPSVYEIASWIEEERDGELKPEKIEEGVAA
ncbi:MAG: thioredoxin family protein [Bacteroidota bacterium]|jgi:hypothetical protein